MQIIMLYVRVVGVNSKDRYLILRSPDPSILYTYVCVLNMKNTYVGRGMKTKLTYLIKL